MSKGMYPKSVALDDECVEILASIKSRGGNLSAVMRALLKEYGKTVDDNLDICGFESSNGKGESVKISVDKETKKIVTEARKFHATNISTAFQILMRQFKDNGFCFNNKLLPKSVHISIDEETYQTLDSIETCGNEIDATIRQLLREFKDNGFRFRSEEG